jgi:hypothetical protein
MNITPVVNLPDVGRGVSDHPIVSAVWTVNSNRTSSTFLDNQTNFNAALAEWNSSGTGPLSFTAPTQVGWLRVPSTDPIFQNASDPSSGPHSAHYELLFGVGVLAIVIITIVGG